MQRGPKQSKPQKQRSTNISIERCAGKERQTERLTRDNLQAVETARKKSRQKGGCAAKASSDSRREPSH
jgi:hypothetical protein